MDAGDATARKMMIMRCGGGVGDSGGGGDVFYNKAIMMRFRPIAPKPVTGDSLPGGSSVDGKNTTISKERTKRKYVRVRRYNRKRKFNDQDNTAVTTLQLLPEKHDGGGYPPLENPAETRNNHPYGNGKEVVVKSDGRREGGELWVTVESVTDTCIEEDDDDDECTDEERRKNLEEDTCPGFITDGLNKVEWLNPGFKRMVVREKQKKNEESEIKIWLVLKEEERMENMMRRRSRRRFTCQMKLQYKWGKEKEMEKDSKRVPCDVWRMEGGGFAWKLDVNTALTLGPHF